MELQSFSESLNTLTGENQSNDNFQEKAERIYQLNKTELLTCVAPGWSKTISQFLNLIDSFSHDKRTSREETTHFTITSLFRVIGEGVFR